MIRRAPLRRLAAAAAAALALASLAQPAAAQGQAGPQVASLVADRVHIAGDSRLVAEGHVQVLQGTTLLSAARVIYDQSTDRLTIEGPITVKDGEEVLILADAAALDADLKNGLLRSARLVLDRQLQLAANQIARVDGRYTQLTKAVASSCEVCAANPVPLWEIRARRIVHDQQERQLYFDNATFRLAGVPVFYIPRLRLPDPTLKRATGFLLPTVRSTSRLGFGVKLPYFIRLGDHADVTLTPYIARSGRTLGLRYRQAVRGGGFSFSGAVTEDSLNTPGQDGQRHYLFGEGRFALPRGYTLSFQLETVSDESYLLDYGYSEKDRLLSEVRIERARRDELIEAGLTGFRTLRDAEVPIRDQLPERYGQLAWEKRLRLGGGDLTFGIDAATVSRASNADQVGRDTQRVGVSAEWRGQARLANGMVGSVAAGLSGRIYNVDQDSRFAPQESQVTPRLMAELRWPFQKTAAGGAQHLLEPVVQLVWSDPQGGAVPNEDSLLVEFDEGNLYAFSRFPGEDRVESGLRANLGLTWTRLDPGGWSLGVTAGRVIRAEDTSQFAPGTGLAGASSDWLLAGRLRMGDRLALAGRALFDDDLSFAKAETRLDWQGGRSAVSASYLWLTAEPQENRPLDSNELSLDASYRFTDGWTGRFGGRFDLNSQTAARAGLGLSYETECISVDLSLSRRYTSSTSVSPTTDFGLQVSLAGIGSGRTGAAPARACRG